MIYAAAAIMVVACRSDDRRSARRVRETHAEAGALVGLSRSRRKPLGAIAVAAQSRLAMRAWRVSAKASRRIAVKLGRYAIEAMRVVMNTALT